MERLTDRKAKSSHGTTFKRLDLRGLATITIAVVEVHGGELLGPLAKDDRGWGLLAWDEVGRRCEEHTLQELLASVLAEEGVVLDGTVKVVNHELEDRFDFLLGVAGVGGKGGILLMISIHDMAKGNRERLPIHHGQGRDGRGTWQRRRHGLGGT